MLVRQACRPPIAPFSTTTADSRAFGSIGAVLRWAWMRDPERVGVDGAHAAAVTDDEDVLARVCMSDLEHGGDDPLGHLLVALTAQPASATVEPALNAFGVGGLELVAGEARPGADVDLAEVGLVTTWRPRRSATT